jgi:hypothetical protein
MSSVTHKTAMNKKDSDGSMPIFIGTSLKQKNTYTITKIKAENSKDIEDYQPDIDDKSKNEGVVSDLYPDLDQSEVLHDRSELIESSISYTSKAKGKIISLSTKHLSWIFLSLIITFILVFVTLFKKPFSHAETSASKILNLKELCHQTTWQPTNSQIFINCTRIDGGTFNVINGVMTCVRWAIDAGVGLIIPRIRTRLAEDARRFSSVGSKFNYLFDPDHFKKSLHEECPQLTIYEDIDGAYNFEKTIVAKPKIEGEDIHSNGTYRAKIGKLLYQNSVDPEESSVIILEDCPDFRWLFGERSESQIRLDLFKAIRFHEPIRVLGEILSKKMKGKFAGLHLRTEKDAAWDGYEDQTLHFLTYLIQNYTDIYNIYVATGDEAVEKKFPNEMYELNYTAHSKWSLAGSNETLINQMKGLSFDQLGAVDYQLMMDSEVFFGIGGSSFAYAIASLRGNGKLSECRCHILHAFYTHFLEFF